VTDVLADLDARGLVHTISDPDGLRSLLAAGPVTLYYGLDPSAPSLHVGNLVGLLVLRRFADAGHRAMGLAGGATGMIGDPSGRSEERNLLDEATLADNVERIAAQIAAVAGLDRVLDNRAWTAGMTLVEFLRDVGKHVTVNSMMARESVRARLESEHGISFTEFSYMLLQANDFAHLERTEGCRLQIGGSDQWGNIVAGIDLIRRLGRPQAFGLCWPLLTDSSGRKMGKTTGERVWLDPALLSPYRFYQHWVQAPDDEVERLLLQLTLLPVDEVAAVTAAHRTAPERREAQRRLAHELTALVHGADAAVAAEAASGVLFGTPLEDVAESTMAALVDEVPTSRLATGDVVGADLPGLLARTGLCASKGEARRKLAEGAVWVNNRRVGPEAAPVAEPDLLFGRYVLLRRGRAAHHLVVVDGP
jgi:tyrosyl-tRNA synthetase